MNDMTNEIGKIEDQIADKAEEAGITKSSVDKAIGEAKTFIDRAQEKIGEAFESAVDAVKENPKAAAGIAAGAAAVVAGAAYGATRLKGSDAKPKPKARSRASSATKKA